MRNEYQRLFQQAVESDAEEPDQPGRAGVNCIETFPVFVGIASIFELSQVGIIYSYNRYREVSESGYAAAFRIRFDVSLNELLTNSRKTPSEVLAIDYPRWERAR